ncbi:type II toxin-antitoxin system Phd/YefM family antitoxin [Actinomadura darangshiensis]|uniref:Antitoxin n=1 Tax=Actinomadura darangshiensis TaxID=705336 RepID=A0A4R5AP46_9ACTN|nr:type II toxin-antitoxin system Phd/YefM family antitoxin [Actinomadura darangshiensis]TDD73396.1 type II toxin-antitoxin system Phd/YefM family antitoxin [Actinomadura darangshiensis]
MDVPVTEARAQFADLVNRVAYTGEPVKLTRRGRVMAALVSPEDLELLEMVRSQRPDLQIGGTVPPGQPSRPAEQPQPAPPMRIAAEYRPPGFNR